MFFDMQKYVYSESAFNALYMELNKRCKNDVFIILQASTHRNFTFNLRFLYELKHKVSFSKSFFFVPKKAWTL